MLNDVEIAAQTTVAPIAQVAAHLGLSAEDVLPYGHDKAKVRLSVLTARGKDPIRLDWFWSRRFLPRRLGKAKRRFYWVGARLGCVGRVGLCGVA